jgi:DNA-binding CsgD family transcriptional regulator
LEELAQVGSFSSSLGVLLTTALVPRRTAFRGRTSELDLVRERVLATLEGQGGVVMIEGPAGVGKSRFMIEAVAGARESGVPVAAAIAQREERDVSFAPLLAALALAKPDGLATVRSELRDRTTAGPLLLALDELQWADRATRRAAERLGTELSAEPILWLLAGRTGRAGVGLDGTFARLANRPGSVRIRLESLSAEDASLVLDDAGIEVEALVANKHIPDAVALAGSVLSGPVQNEVAAAALRLRFSSILFMLGRPAEATAEAERIMGVPNMPAEIYASAEFTMLLAEVERGELALARQRAEAILAGANRAGTDSALAAALTAVSLIAWEQGRPANADAFIRAAVGRAERGPMSQGRNFARMGLIAILSASGQFGEAEKVIATLRQEIDLDGDAVWNAAPAIHSSVLHVATGRIDDAIEEATTALALCDELGTRYFTPTAQWVLASAHLLQGRLKDAEAHVNRLSAELQAGGGPRLSALLAWVTGRLAEAVDGPVSAFDQVSGMFEALESRPRLLVEEPGSTAWLTRTALASGHTAKAERMAVLADRLAIHSVGFGSLQASATHAAGLIGHDVEQLRQAARGYRHPWPRGTANEDAGDLLLAGDDRADAAPAFKAALTAYRRAGATRDAARVRDRLDELASRRSRRRRPDRLVSGWASLTETERAVARLVAEGLTNPQVGKRMFVSRHTVDFHLRQIFRKLAIRSRVELTRLTLEQEHPG